MKALVDTPIWSLALRRQPRHLNPVERRLVEEWVELVQTGQAQIIGPIRQEVLSGVRRTADFDQLRERLEAFEDLPLVTVDYEQAASFFDQCRSKGVTGTPIDLLLCAVAHRREFAIFTTDSDFEDYSRILPIRLYARSLSEK